MRSYPSLVRVTISFVPLPSVAACAVVRRSEQPLDRPLWFLKHRVVPLLLPSAPALSYCTCTQLVTVFSGDRRVPRFSSPRFLQAWMSHAGLSMSTYCSLSFFAICIVCMSNQDNLENKRLPRKRKGNLTCRSSQNVLFLKCYAVMYVWLIQ